VPTNGLCQGHSNVARPFWFPAATTRESEGGTEPDAGPSQIPDQHEATAATDEAVATTGLLQHL
jgi:hypothetical protein